MGSYIIKTFLIRPKSSEPSWLVGITMILQQGSLESKRPIDWPRILLAVIMTIGSLWRSVEAYIKGCNVCMALKAVRHAPRLPPIVTGADSLLDGSIHVFCHGIACFHQLERQQLRFDSQRCYSISQLRLRSMLSASRKASTTYGWGSLRPD